METLRTLFSGIFGRSKSQTDSDGMPLEAFQTTEADQQQSEEEDSDTSEISDMSSVAQLPPPPFELHLMPEQASVKYIEEEPDTIDYAHELVNFIDHNAPQGFAQKFQVMLPYLGLSFVSWPAYWIFRGLSWQHYRANERIGVYIQKTFQHAKFMQVAILATGLIMATSVGPRNTGIQVHEVRHERTELDDNGSNS